MAGDVPGDELIDAPHPDDEVPGGELLDDAYAATAAEEQEAVTAPPAPRTRVWQRVALAGCMVLALVGAFLLGAGWNRSPVRGDVNAVPAPGAVAGAPSAATSSSASPSRQAPSSASPPASSVHVQVPSVGLDLPLFPLSVPDGVIDPPLLTAGYWLQGYGAPTGSAKDADNTVYLAAHSTNRGSSGFDALLSADHRSAAVQAGATIQVSTAAGTASYTVERTARYDTDELATASEVWQDVPGRLVLITCLTPTSYAPTTEDLVVFASAR